MKFLKMFLYVINKISFVGMIIIGLFALFAEIFGIPKAEKILNNINISWSFGRIMLIGFILVAIMLISYLIRKKFLNE